MIEIVVDYECPKCGSILTNWDYPENHQHVCDCCGYGKHSHDEFIECQRLKIIHLEKGQEQIG